MRLALAIVAVVVAGPALAEPAMLPTSYETRGICEALRVDRSINPHSPIIVRLDRPHESWGFICFATANGLMRPAAKRTVSAE